MYALILRYVYFFSDRADFWSNKNGSVFNFSTISGKKRPLRSNRVVICLVHPPVRGGRHQRVRPFPATGSPVYRQFHLSYA